MWHPKKSITEEEFISDVVQHIASTNVSRPRTFGEILGAKYSWREIDPGVAEIRMVNGNELAYAILKEHLKLGGLEIAEGRIEKLADWTDVEEKAKRLVQENQVTVLRNGAQSIVGHVVGDHGEYQTEIWRNDPNSRAITYWDCDCPWSDFAWQRTRKWKKYEGRCCSHTLATYWKALTLPLDEDAHPQQAQQQLFNMPQTPPTGTPTPGGVTPMAPSQQMTLPGMFPGQATGTPPVPSTQVPQGPSIIPPFPGAQQPVISVPGAKPQSPLNPIQYPGGTFSKVAADPFIPQPEGFENGNMVQLLEDEMGIAQGKSKAHGAGEWRQIKRNSVGEVMGQDPITKLVQVNFPIHDSGPMEPYSISAWFFPSQLKLRPDIRRPGPFIKRRT